VTKTRAAAARAAGPGRSATPPRARRSRGTWQRVRLGHVASGLAAAAARPESGACVREMAPRPGAGAILIPCGG
jgi:hypothetical protein